MTMRFDFSEFVSLWGENYGLWCTLANTMDIPTAAAMLRAAARAFGGLDTMAAGTLARALARDAAAGKGTKPPAIEPVAIEPVARAGTRPRRIYEAMEAARFPGWRRAALEDWAMLSTGDMTTEAWPAAAGLLSAWARAALSIDMSATEAAWSLLMLADACYGKRPGL